MLDTIIEGLCEIYAIETSYTQEPEISGCIRTDYDTMPLGLWLEREALAKARMTGDTTSIQFFYSLHLMFGEAQ